MKTQVHFTGVGIQARCLESVFDPLPQMPDLRLGCRAQLIFTALREKDSTKERPWETGREIERERTAWPADRDSVEEGRSVSYALSGLA